MDGNTSLSHGVDFAFVHDVHVDSYLYLFRSFLESHTLDCIDSTSLVSSAYLMRLYSASFSTQFAYCPQTKVL